jgi:GxxExxY protein
VVKKNKLTTESTERHREKNSVPLLALCGKKNKLTTESTERHREKKTPCNSVSSVVKTKKIKKMEINQITEKIIGCAIEVHKNLGPGLLESAYEECLYYELNNLGLGVKRQLAMPLVYKDVKLDAGYRIDLLVENKVIVEIKSVEAIAEIHKAQLMTYMKLANIKIGLLINFNVSRLKDGIIRWII